MVNVHSRLLGCGIVLLCLAVVSGCGSAESRKARYFERGEHYLASHDYPKAGVEFRNALQIDPNYARARIQLGQVFEKTGNARAALGQYEAVIDNNPNNVEARGHAARIYALARMPEKAFEVLAPAITAHPDDPNLLLARAAARAEQKDTVAALADAQAAYRKDPDNEEAVGLIASLLRSQGDLPGAVAVVQGAIQHHPQSAELHVVLSSLYLAKDDPAEAEAELKKTIELDPQTLEHRYQLARFYMFRQNGDAAERTLREAVTALPKSDEAKQALVGLTASRHGQAAAEQTLRDFIQQNPDNDQLRLMLATAQEAAHETAAAAATYQEIIQRSGTRPSALTARDRLAALDYAQGKAQDAAQLVNAVIKESAQDDQALMLRAQMALDRGDANSAIVDLRADLRNEPDSAVLLRTLARAHVMNQQPALAVEALRTALQAHPKDPITQVQLARLLVQQGESDEALKILQQAVADTPTDLPAQETLLRLQLHQKDYGGARSTAVALQKALPKKDAGSYLLGIVDEAENKPDDAARDYTAALDLDPGDVQALAALVRVQVARGQGKQALERLDKIQQQRPDDAVVGNLRGEVLSQLNRNEEAVAAFTAAIEKAPSWWEPYQELAHAQEKLHHTDAAVATLESGLEKTHDNPVLAGSLTALFEVVGEPEKAIGVYEDLLKRHPDSVVVANNLAMLLVSYRSDAASLARAQSLAKPLESSKNASFQDTAGWVRYKGGEFQQALPLLQAAVAQSPESVLMRYHLGMAQLKTGDRDGARRNIELALDSGRTFLGQQDARNALNELKHDG
ncbi:MAG: tetratricopeptide repeat protein [Proteobacteria bacterium]|nr:tetratricopeptide repeat protein [Pseudomonadota bacterium]